MSAPRPREARPQLIDAARDARILLRRETSAVDPRLALAVEGAWRVQFPGLAALIDRAERRRP